MKKTEKILSLALSVMLFASLVIMPSSIFAKEDDGIGGGIEIVNTDKIEDATELQIDEKKEDLVLKKYETFEDFSYRVLEDNTAEIFGYNGDTTVTSIKIPSEVNGLTVTSLDQTFNRKNGLVDNLKSVELPSTLVKIGDDTFSGCSALTEINIPNTVKSIGDRAFWDCGSLENITLPSELQSIGAGAFNGCKQLKQIKFPNGLKSIGALAFYDCVNLMNVIIPDSVTTLGDEESGNGIFMGCTGLTDVKIGRGITSIDNTMFSSCTALKNVILPNTLTYIGECTFMECSSLETIKIPEKVTTIGEMAFYSCEGLENINIPDSVTSIGESAFGECQNLRSLFIGSSVKEIGDLAFDGCGINDFQTEPSFTIYCFEGSAAEAYCKENGIDYYAYALITSLTTDVKTKNLVIGNTFQLKTTIKPDNTFKTVLWKSSNSKVATVSTSGKVTSKAVGKAIISVMATDGSGKVATVTVKVLPAKVSKVTIKAAKKEATLTISKTKGAKQYEIYRSDKKNKGFKKIGTTSKLKYIDKKKLKSKKTYYYKVRAINKVGKETYIGAFSKVYRTKIK